MNIDLTENQILFLAFACVALIAYLFIPKDFSLIKNNFTAQKGKKTGLLLLVSPFIIIIGEYLEKSEISFIKKYLEYIKRILISGALNNYITNTEFLGLQILTPIIFYPFLILATLRIEAFSALKEPFAAFTAVIIIFIVAFSIPYLILNDKVQKRKKSISRELPFALDMLTSAVEAGLDFSGAIRRFVQKASKMTPLKEEFELMLKEINIGKTRSEALMHVSERANLNELTNVVNSLIQADQLGTSVGAVLTTLSDDIRTKRFQKAEKMALEAPVKMLFPLIAFIFPAVFIILLGPLILQIVSELGK